MGVWIGFDGRVHKKLDWHVHRFTRLQCLLVKAETRNLVEIGARLFRRHIIDGGAGDGGIARVGRPVGDDAVG